MPLLSPNIDAALRSVGLTTGDSEKGPDLKKQLDRAGLSTERILEQLEQEMVGADSSNSRLRAAELSLKLHGVLKETSVPLPTINITILDSEKHEINPILIPREIQI
jgi:hypothetical protein